MIGIFVAATCLSVAEGYTITTTLRLAQPYDVKAMNDEFQSARLLSERGGVGTFEITYRPFHVQTVTADPLWRTHDARMSEYLKPRACANWDEGLKARLVADLAADGIDVAKLDDRTLVQRVSSWALRRSSFNNQFGLWMVEFKGGKPAVAATLSEGFRDNEPAHVPLQKLYDQELFGKGMYLNRTHGACTSSSTYMATILRALGIPTRIILTVPACDFNDPAQVAMLTKAIRHHGIVREIRGASSARGFVNHVYNEVWVGGKWVRLNYDRLGQPIVDANYCGMMTHVYTALDVSEIPFAQTWGARYALHSGPKLSSENPYQLVAAHDMVSPGYHLDNPEIPVLSSVTVTAVVKRGDPAIPMGIEMPDNVDAFLRIKEWIPGQNYMQLRDFENGAGARFTLRAAGHADLTATLTGLKVSDEHGGFQAFAVKLSGKPDAGACYQIFPQNGAHPHVWKIAPSVVWPF